MAAVAVFLLLVSSLAAFAQVEMARVEDQDAARAEEAFARAAAAGPMKCAIKPSAPALNFSLNYEAGFILTFPLDSPRGPSGKLNIFVRIGSPKAGEKPFYLATKYDLPGGPRGDEGMLTGRFGLGSGTWRVDALATDSEGRVCRAGWRAEIKPGPAEAIADSQRPLRRLLILIDAAPIHAAYGRLPEADLDMFIGSLSALLRLFPAQSTRLIVFNLEQRKELYRSDGLQPAALKEIGERIQATSAGTVNYADVQRRPPASEFLGGLIARDIGNGEDAELVVFMGPAVQDPIPPERQTIAAAGLHPAIAYLQFRPARNVTMGPGCPPVSREYGGAPCRPMGAQVHLPTIVIRDAISEAVAQLGGMTLAVSDPAELAKSLRDLAHHAQPHSTR